VFCRLLGTTGVGVDGVGGVFSTGGTMTISGLKIALKKSEMALKTLAMTETFSVVFFDVVATDSA